jgi:uncharacterized protein (TIGR02246 family)
MQSQQAAKQSDEHAIREMVDTWLAASKRGDTETLLNLLADDVVFITPGREPFGKEAFTNANKDDIKMEATIDIKELEVLGDWAWMRSFLRLTFTNDSESKKHSGHILTILNKRPDGQWVIKRDANFVAPETTG